MRPLTPRQLLKKIEQIVGHQTFADDLKPLIVAEIERRQHSSKADERRDAKGLTHLLTAVEREIEAGDASRAAYFAFVLCSEGLEKVANIGIKMKNVGRQGGLESRQFSEDQHKECAELVHQEVLAGENKTKAYDLARANFGEMSRSTARNAYEKYILKK